MAKLTYLDPNEDAPKIVWYGVTFIAHKPVDTDKEELIEAAKSHPYFKVTGAKAAKAEEPEPAAEDPAESSKAEEPGKPHWDDDEPKAEEHPHKRKKHKKDAW